MENERILNHMIASSPFFFIKLQFLGLIFDTSTEMKSLQKLEIFTFAEVSNISPGNWSLCQKNGELATMFVI